MKNVTFYGMKNVTLRWYRWIGFGYRKAARVETNHAETTSRVLPSGNLLHSY
jgi:hypothetical protein